MGAHGLNDEISRQLALLNQNDKLLNEIYHNYAAKLNLSDTAFWILYIAWIQGDGCTQKQLCEMWSYSKQTINSALKNLEKQGYIKLLTTTLNRKSKQILFTEDGRRFAQSVISPLLEAEAGSFGLMSAEERDELVRLSQKRTELFQKGICKTLLSENDS